MNDIIFETICSGNLEELKKIPKSELSNSITKKLINSYEHKLKELEINIINIACEDSEMKYLTCGYKDLRFNIENCIKYLKKINQLI